MRLVEKEILNNKGPFTSIAPTSQRLFGRSLRGSRHHNLDKLTEAGCDYRTEKIEVIPAAHSVLAGLEIDINSQTTIPGVFAAGENATGIHGAGRLSGNGLTACAVMGLTCGKNASGYAKNAQCNSKSVMAKKTVSFEQLKKSLNIFTEQSQASNVNNDMKVMVEKEKHWGNNLGIIRNE